MTTAARLALKAGFSELAGVERIEALVDPQNAGSVRVLEKAGMVREGCLRRYIMHRGQISDRYIYAIYK